MQTGGWNAELETGPAAARACRSRAMLNLSRMGHCAPAVAQTLLDLTRSDGPWLVRLAAGLPGGIGNTGFECGGVTAALLLLGLRHGGATTARGLPVVVEEGHAYCARFRACHGSLLCSGILGKRRLPLPCVKVIRGAPELLAETVHGDAARAIPPAEAEGYARLWRHLEARGFHCAHAVLRRIAHLVPATPALLAATQGFVGGTIFQGLTCSALAAGVMALGLGAGEIEDRRSRVGWMLVKMALGGDAFADDLNRFNPSMNRGKALAEWFAREHGSTQCRAITGCAFSSAEDVRRFVEGGQLARCEELAASVAARTEAMLAGLPH